MMIESLGSQLFAGIYLNPSFYYIKSIFSMGTDIPDPKNTMAYLFFVPGKPKRPLKFYSLH